MGKWCSINFTSDASGQVSRVQNAFFNIRNAFVACVLRTLSGWEGFLQQDVDLEDDLVTELVELVEVLVTLLAESAVSNTALIEIIYYY